MNLIKGVSITRKIVTSTILKLRWAIATTSVSSGADLSTQFVNGVRKG